MVERSQDKYLRKESSLCLDSQSCHVILAEQAWVEEYLAKWLQLEALMAQPP